jgi:vancomycin resistance protein YoaR
VFHAAFWAGLRIDERHAHAYWIPRYGVGPRGVTGLDAAVDEDTKLDFRFTNTTGAPIVAVAQVDGTRVLFRLLGTRPGWDIATSGPTITNQVRADSTTVRQEEPTLAAGRTIAIEEARDGFDVLLGRTVTKGGQEIDRLDVRSKYVPSRNVLLVGTRR